MFSTNGTFLPTERGHLVNELVRISYTLKQLEKPGVAFAMNETYKINFQARREELCNILGLPNDEKSRRMAIAGYDGYLRRFGFPYWRVKI